MAPRFADGSGKSRKGLYGGLAAVSGIALLAYSLGTHKESGIPGWQPANTALQATLAEGEAPVEVSRKPTEEPAVSPSMQASPPPAAAGSGAPSPLPANPAPLDLNRATESELDTLPGIGPAKAKAIVAYRDDRKGFRSVDELLEVKGIGAKLLERIRPLVTLSPGAAGGG
ncbi:ComEA family DNA-binding protein [Cohnella candidum]|uniref:Helix-hairpin-helix domain-containing protein n=1 Tax=Cohnella candidum TaxID=2674991 RepID=A0A3G3JU03_9BACL|nr:helix-hairpin-helix domain-containing protein [Cohnella candidum]AYQ71710.1 helix-hairpin-helix domain-containing protein [Cohnella candidum]